MHCLHSGKLGLKTDAVMLLKSERIPRIIKAMRKDYYYNEKRVDCATFGYEIVKYCIFTSTNFQIPSKPK